MINKSPTIAAIISSLANWIFSALPFDIINLYPAIIIKIIAIPPATPRTIVKTLSTISVALVSMVAGVKANEPFDTFLEFIIGIPLPTARHTPFCLFAQGGNGSARGSDSTAEGGFAESRTLFRSMTPLAAALAI